MVSGFLRALRTRASSSRNAALDAPSLAPTNGIAETASYRSGRQRRCAPCGRRGWWRRDSPSGPCRAGSGRPRSGQRSRCREAPSWSLMYFRVCSMAGEPDGRGADGDQLTQVLPGASGVEGWRRGLQGNHQGEQRFSQSPHHSLPHSTRSTSPRILRSFVPRNVVALSWTRVDLPGTGDLLLRVEEHLLPLRDPTGCARNGEEDWKHFDRETPSPDR